MRVPIQGLFNKNDIIKLIEEQGVLNKAYDDNLDGFIDWNKLNLFGIRTEVLKYFENPNVIIFSSAKDLLNACDSVVAGSVSATSKEITIVGGKSTATGNTWIYIELPNPATRIYGCAYLNSVNTTWITFEFFAGSNPATTIGGTGDTEYYLVLNIPASADDFKLTKVVNGIATKLASESVDLSYNVYYFVEMFLDNNNNILKAWRDGVFKFSVTPDTTNLPSITAIRFRVDDTSTTTAQSGKVKLPVIILYE